MACPAPQLDTSATPCFTYSIPLSHLYTVISLYRGKTHLVLMIFIINLIRFRITMETKLWACLWGIIWIRLPEVGYLTLSVGSITLLGSVQSWRNRSQCTVYSSHLTLLPDLGVWKWSCLTPATMHCGFPTVISHTLKLWANTNPSFLP